MKIIKKLFLAAALLFSFATGLQAENALYQTENYILNVSYNETLVPGDAVFVRLTVSLPKNAIPKSHKKNEKYVEPERKATMRLYQGSKVIEKADFYSLEKKGNNEQCWKLVSGFLDGLELATEEQGRLGLVRFLWRFLELLGVQPDSSYCGSCGKSFITEKHSPADMAYYNRFDNDFICSSYTDSRRLAELLCRFEKGCKGKIRN